MGVGGQRHAPAALPPGKRPAYMITCLVTKATKVTSVDAVAVDTFATTLAMVTVVTKGPNVHQLLCQKCCAVRKGPFEWAQLRFLFRMSKVRRRLA
jgi:hypothetical protein